MKGKTSQYILPITVACTCSIRMKRGWTHCVYFKPPPAFLTNRIFTNMWTLCILEHIFGKISVVLFILQGFKENLCFSCDEKNIQPHLVFPTNIGKHVYVFSLFFTSFSYFQIKLFGANLTFLSLMLLENYSFKSNPLWQSSKNSLLFVVVIIAWLKMTQCIKKKEPCLKKL